MAKQPRKRSSPRSRPAKTGRSDPGQSPPVVEARTSSGDRDPQPAPAFPVVGIGASAGGLDAISVVLRHLPADTRMAFVVLQHLAPRHDNLLVELLRNCTTMPVVAAEDGMRLEPDHVYVMPPGGNLELRGDVLHVVPRAKATTAVDMPIDHFFRSLAEERKSAAIGVILSGTASDGALGMRTLKAQGGITLAQDPATAKYDGMPRAAIGAGAADLVLSLEGIAAELAKIGKHPYVAPPRGAATATAASGAPIADATDENLKRVFLLLKQSNGVDFTYYKHATIQRRLKRRMVLHKLERLADYVRFLHQHPAELDALYQDMLIHVTGFFREPEAFVALRKIVFPAVLANQREDSPIRIWVPGCATGEETYSIAMALLEYLEGAKHSGTPVQIFATDVSEAAIDKARAGLYPENIKGDVSPERLRRFFSAMDGGYRVTKTVRDMCVFARQDLTKDPPFSQLDLISCRNVMIYLGSILQKRAMAIFHYALKPSGFLLLGASETIGSYADLFAPADKEHKIYVKKAPLSRPSLGFSTEYSAERFEPPKPGLAARGRGEMVVDVDRLLLDRLAPNGVVVNSEMQIVQVRGQTGKYLQPATGDATLNVLKMSRPGLMIELRTALHAARKSGRSVAKKGVRVKQNGHVAAVDFEVVPLDNGGGVRASA